jgi:gliding motility-associated-like protein
MKKYFFILALFLLSIPATARHVAGGELFYEYISSNGNSTTYRITLRLFRECESTGPQLERETPFVGFYVNGTKTPNDILLSQIGSTVVISLNTAAFPCLVGEPSVCYQMAIFSGTVTLPNTTSGYTLSTLGCCRVDGISNLVPGPGNGNSANIGNNYVTYIPGTNALPLPAHNNSPQFNVRDTALVCSNKKFSLDFGATDSDGDSLTFALCEAFTSGLSGSNIRPAQSLGTIPLPYVSPYSGSSPLGGSVTINEQTGIISGTAPSPGKYVVNVCITEWRNGAAISQHRKDFLLKVQSCDFVEADLPDKIIQCRDSIVHFENQSSSSAVIDYLWEFGDNTGKVSTLPTVDYPYADTGRYTVRLTVHGPKGCVGMDSTEVIVYPGFTPAFGITGSCYLLPYHFSDSTYTKYGVVDSWRWDFGDLSANIDTSTRKNPAYKYIESGSKKIKLVVTNSKGCIDSLQKTFLVRDKPSLNLPFKDTLICSIDTLAIPVSGSGTFSWLPNKNILFGNTSTALVFPKDTTRYIVTVVDQGCTNSDTVTVNVLQFITVKLRNDTLICSTDVMQLHAESQALQYQWTASSGETVAPVKSPFIQPLVTTKYYVTANLGKCQDRDSVTIRSIPYPSVMIGPDTAICFGSRLQLHSTGSAAFINWTPTSTLVNFTSRSPIAGPTRTTTYIATVRDTLGCPKIVSDTIVVIVAPTVKANAGQDTVALIGQPLQLLAEGGVKYEWSPETFLSNVFIANPVALIPQGVDSMRYYVRVSDQYGCFAEDNVLVKLYKTVPEMFVPTAFTPNGDGKNDELRPTTVGISTLNFFRIYNRYGQLLFSTTEIGKGWDGVYNGSPQPSGTYVFQAQGVDYKGTVVFRKGTAVLIR